MNAGITPVVHEYGSLGCSGDLAPLAHVRARADGRGRRARRAAASASARPTRLRDAGLEPVVLAEKEGLALINGTDGMLGSSILAIDDGGALMQLADVAAAMSIQALRGTDQVFLAEIHALRPHPGQRDQRGQHARRSWPTRAIVELAPRRPDPGAGRLLAALRAPGRTAPRATRSAYATQRGRRRTRLGDRQPVGARRRPLVSNGNFHGAPIGYVLDFLAIAVADVASMSRAAHRPDARRAPLSYGLPPFLAGQAGVDSGLMIAQYAQAALVSEMKRLAAPASVDSIPSSGDAGGPRVDGLARRAQTAPGRSTPSPTCSPSSCSPAARALDLRAR